MQYTCYVDVLLPLPVPNLYTYAVSNDKALIIKAGIRVTVQFGRKNHYTALVILVHSNKPKEYQVKEIIGVIDEEPVVLETQLRLWEWISEYYLCTLGEVYKAALPGLMKLQGKPRTSPLKNIVQAGLTLLNTPQQKALSEIKSSFEKHEVVLLHGVTSSGKTEIYIHLMQEMINHGRQVLYLLPEISLTTQIVSRLEAVFGPRIAVYHSGFTNAQRGKVWKDLLYPDSKNNNGVQIVLGVRSAVFLPFRNPGLVIIDEEHENTFKQFEPSPRYHARDTAIMLARFQGAKVLLGTATPSVETYYNCQRGKYKLVELNERYLNLELPEITVVDTRDLHRRKKMQSHFSPVLLDNIDNALKNGEQVILFQNRRGFSLFLECRRCSNVPLCRYCDVSLIYHKKDNQLYCHYCGYHIPVPEVCPKCRQGDLQMKGFGTEKIEEEIALFFPHARVDRMDLDAMRKRQNYEKLIARFEMKESDILVGTQMVSKGLNFNNVKLVGIMNADTMLNYPDFRAHERSYQLMAQVSGRAGRKNGRGKVIIQTSDHRNKIISMVIHNDFQAMYFDQLEERRNFCYPPFYRLIKITLKHRNKDLLDQAALFLYSLMRESMDDKIIGPEYPVVSRIRNMYLKSMLVKIVNGKPLPEVKLKLLSCIKKMTNNNEFRAVPYIIDVDPY
jgi:primosomal protein N' (replication factor Y) (superfamily II helicase)